MKKLKIIFIFIIYFIFFINPSNSLENKILFKVNNEIITTLDIFNELKFLEIINEKLRNTEKKQAFEIAKRSLIREKIKEIELKKIVEEVKIQDELLENILVNYFEKIEINTISDFNNYFSSMEISPDIIKKKISIDVLWNQLIYRKYNQNIKIDRQDIINNLSKNDKQKQFFLSEILFNLKKNEKLKSKFNIIKNKIDKSNFFEAALVHSVSDTAKKGGELGWINESALSKKINDVLQDIKIGSYTSPILIPSGFLILKIEDIRKIENDYDQDEEIEKIIEEKTNEQLNQFSNIFFNKIMKDVKINEL